MKYTELNCCGVQLPVPLCLHCTFTAAVPVFQELFQYALGVVSFSVELQTMKKSGNHAATSYLNHVFCASLWMATTRLLLGDCIGSGLHPSCHCLSNKNKFLH